MRGAIVLLAGLALTGAAHAAPPAVTAAAAPAAARPPSLFGTHDYGTTVVVHL